MALKSTLEMLEELQTAISAVMQGKSITMVDGYTYTQENLDALTARETLLLDRYRREGGSRPRVSYGDFGGIFS